MTWLGRHVGHRLYAVDANHLRCKDCDQTGVIGTTSGAGSTSGTSNPALPLNLADRTACPFHVGERTGACGPCRSEQLEASEPRSLTKWGNDPRSVTAWQQARERLAQRRSEKLAGEAS